MSHRVKPFIRLAIAIATASFGLPACLCASPPTGIALSVSWQLLENRSDNRFKSQLILRNDGRTALSGSWELYFNSPRQLAPDSVGPDCRLAHINGDLYVLRPAPSFQPVAQAGHRTISLDGSPWAINISDAPSGFYIVLDQENGKSRAPVPLPLEIKPFPEASKLRRGADDAVPLATAESRYRENESLTTLPPEQLVKVVPTPVEIREMSGRVTIDSTTAVFYEPSLANEANYAADAIGELFNRRLTAKAGFSAKSDRTVAIRLRIGEIKLAGLIQTNGNEAYQLTIDPETGVEIIGSDPAGVFYGVQTFRALLPITSYRRAHDEIVVDAVQIADAPRFRYRGLHLDVARNFQSKRAVEKLLDVMSFYKLNRLHLHLTDDEGWRIEIKQLPELTEVGGRRGHTLDETECLIPSLGSGPFPDSEKNPGSGFYSQDEFVQLLRYAQERHVAIIPELDLPGHARAAVKSLEATQRLASRSGNDQRATGLLLREPGDKSRYESVQMWSDNVVDVGRPDTYRFLELVVGELIALYERAGVPLTTIHLGGDEVPNGAWEKSAACRQIELPANSKTPRRGQLELYFLNRASEILSRHSIQPACWEDCLLLDVDGDPAAGNHRRAAGKPVPIAYVWNNVWGWGREDAAYRIANAGFDVVLCNATHLYFDLACEKDPLEPGYYWAGFVNMRAPFEFVPLDVFKNAGMSAMGQPLNQDTLASRARLTPAGKQHILGLQGELWAENLRTPRSWEYMAFPRVICLAERSWARSPDWAQTQDHARRRTLLDRDWNQFANRLGQRELPRLDYLSGGVQYRLPPPGAVIRDGHVFVNVAFPGLNVRYTTDGTHPDATALLFHESIELSTQLNLRSFDTRGRGSRVVNLSDQAP